MMPHFAIDAKEPAVAFDFHLRMTYKECETRNHCVLVSSSCCVLRRLALLQCRNAGKGEDHKDFDVI